MIDFLIVLFAVVSQGTPEETTDPPPLPPRKLPYRQLAFNLTDMLAMTRNAPLMDLSHLNNETGGEALPYICFADISNSKDLRLRDCCNFPPLFPESVMDICGVRNVLARRSFPELNPDDQEHCSHFNCVLSRSHLLNDDSTIDVMKVYSLLDAWVEQNFLFENVVNLIKDKCVDKELPASHPCPSKFLAGCIVTTLAFACPSGWRRKPECVLLKQLLHLCGPFVMQSSKLMMKNTGSLTPDLF